MHEALSAKHEMFSVTRMLQFNTYAAYDVRRMRSEQLSGAGWLLTLTLYEFCSGKQIQTTLVLKLWAKWENFETWFHLSNISSG